MNPRNISMYRTADEIVVYPWTRRRINRFYASIVLLVVVAQLVLYFSFGSFDHGSFVIVFFGAALAAFYVVVVSGRLMRRQIHTAGTETVGILRGRRCEYSPSTWGDRTIWVVEYDTGGARILSERSVHPAVWKAHEPGGEVVIRYLPKRPNLWVAAPLMDDAALETEWNRTTRREHRAW